MNFSVESDVYVEATQILHLNLKHVEKKRKIEKKSVAHDIGWDNGGIQQIIEISSAWSIDKIEIIYSSGNIETWMFLY